jgi:hypothetical protein
MGEKPNEPESILTPEDKAQLEAELADPATTLERLEEIAEIVAGKDILIGPETAKKLIEYNARKIIKDPETGESYFARHIDPPATPTQE